MSPDNVQRDHSLTTLVGDTSNISLTSFGNLDTNSFRDAFNGKIIFIASFVPNFSSSAISFKAFI